jgi:DNA-binding LytR/AlgR family response regulator
MSNLTHPAPLAHAPIVVTSAFGTSFRIAVDSAEDYLLHPAFLRFALICLTIRALLEQGDDVRLLQGWQVPVLWLMIGLASVLMLVVTIALLRLLSRAGAGRRVYTPILFVPLVVVGEYATQGVIGVFQAGYAKPLDVVLVDLARDMLVLVMFDALHALYVVPVHPLAQSDAQRMVAAPVLVMEESREAPEPEMPEPEDEAADEVARGPELETVRIGERVFPLAELVAVRTEDHYLNVITRNGRCMLRAKLSDVEALHSGRHGVQINRSHWVAFAAISAMREERNGQIVLDLTNGDSATVARSRRLVFLQLYQGGLRGRG